MRNDLVIFFFFLGCFVLGQNKDLKNSPKDIELLLNISKSFDVVNTDSAVYYAEKALSVAEKRKIKLAESYGALGYALFMGFQYDRAIENLNKAIDYSKDENYKGGIYAILAFIYYQKREIETAIDYADKAEESLNKTIETPEEAMNRLRLNTVWLNIYQAIGDFEKSYLFGEKALNIAEELKDTARVLRILNSIATTHDRNLQREKAVGIYKRILDNPYVNSESNINIAIWNYNLAKTYIKLNKTDSAEIHLNKAYKLLVDNPRSSVLGSILLTQAELLIEKSHFSNVNEKLEQAKDIYEERGISGKIGEVYFFEGKLHYKMKNNSRAIDSFEKAKTIFEENNLLQELSLVYYYLYEISEDNQEYKKAIQYMKLYRTVRDSLYNNEKLVQTTNFEIRYQTARKETQINQQQLEIERQKRIMNLTYTGGGSALLLIVSSVLWFRNKQKRKELQQKNSLLELQQKLIESELSSLNNQLNPHEIKNLLASISPEIQEKAPDSYRRMIKLLNVTKASLNNSITESLGNQFIQIEDYILLQKNMHFVPINFEIRNELKNTQIQIPRLLLKNLVENAVKHGVVGNEKGGEVIVTTQEVEDSIVLTVSNTWQKNNLTDEATTTGIGLSTYQKLFSILNQRNEKKAHLKLIKKENNAIVKVKIPLNYIYT